ncbi:Uncharacterised protein [Serratia marcescens]|nr:Uncharacterised protein [Serratia marcescens]
MHTCMVLVCFLLRYSTALACLVLHRDVGLVTLALHQLLTDGDKAG